MKFNPLGDRVLIQRVNAKEVTKGGIIIPDNAKEAPVEGKVIAIGPGATNHANSGDPLKPPMVLKIGDHVLFGKYAGSEVQLDGEKYTLMREEDVLGVLTEY